MKLNKRSSIQDKMMDPKSFFIRTPMIDELSEIIHKWHLNGSPGGVILGANRIGKSFALMHLKDKITSRNNTKIKGHYISISPRDVGTITSLYRQLSKSANLKVTDSTRSDIMANDFIHYLGESAHTSKSPKNMVLFVDEMQRLKPRQFEVFAEIYDNLLLHGIHISIIFVGNYAASKNLIKLMQKQTQYELIRGRFFLKLHRYFGIRTRDELFDCISEIDKEYLIAKEGSYIDIYMNRHGLNKNWKFSSLTDVIWNVYIEYFQKEINIESWGLQYFFNMIRVLLFDFMPDNGIEDSFMLSQMIEGSINASGLVPDLIEEF